MRIPFFLLTFIGLLGIIGCKKGPYDKVDLKENLQQILDKQLARYKDTFPGKAVGFGLYIKSAGGSHGRSGQDVYVSSGFPKEYGEAVQFRGASTTKTFTAAAILKLHQQGKLDIDHLITDNRPGTTQPYIPATSEFAIPNKNKITIRLLLQHRAGVFDVTNTDIPKNVNALYAGKRYLDYVLKKEGDNHTFTIPEMINVVAQNQLSYFKPNESFHYSNTGYHLLTLIIERVSGKRYDQFLKDEFLTPLQLNHTFFPYLGTDQQLPKPYVTGWLKINRELTEVTEDNVSSIVGDGNVVTTPLELATWANALYGSNKILNADLHAQMITGILTNEEHVNYGLGTELHPPDLGYGHNGAHPAYMTIMRYHPGTNASYVLFCNFLNVDDFSSQGKDLENIVRQAVQAVETSR
ncbi:MAG TPA: serine hydrolase domain-containing protein [Chitinophagaceae bacterium]|jgi:D-alanyl-D-alanine carboxypeptidase|nr:serine hydrolase domain-containing protein [Chitinophagaceae bacterium]